MIGPWNKVNIWSIWWDWKVVRETKPRFHVMCTMPSSTRNQYFVLAISVIKIMGILGHKSGTLKRPWNINDELDWAAFCSKQVYVLYNVRYEWISTLHQVLEEQLSTYGTFGPTVISGTCGPLMGGWLPFFMAFLQHFEIDLWPLMDLVYFWVVLCSAGPL
jgi:hypothetical protein